MVNNADPSDNRNYKGCCDAIPELCRHVPRYDIHICALVENLVFPELWGEFCAP